MKSQPDYQSVADELGEKVVEALGRVVAMTRHDFAGYRGANPALVAQASTGGLASWIQDRMWANALVAFDEMDGVFLYEHGSTREIIVHNTYRIRLKRHQLDGAVRSFPTATALEFFDEFGQLALPELGEIPLVAGYEWDTTTHTMGRAVLSLHRGRAHAVWVEELPSAPSDGTSSVSVITPAVDAPKAPEIIVAGDDGATEENVQE